MIDISVSDLVKSFQIGENMLNGVTFHVNEGERVGILGKNGSGKTTLFKILTGEYDYDEGQVTLAPGQSASASSPRFRSTPRRTPWRMCWTLPLNGSTPLRRS